MEWISVEDRLPEKCNQAYLCTDGESYEIMYWHGMYKDSPNWSSYNCFTLDVTHWMPLPEPPK